MVEQAAPPPRPPPPPPRHGRRRQKKKNGGSCLGLNCIACHEAGKDRDPWLLRKQAPILDEVGSRGRPLPPAFLGDPQAVKPGTTMPQPLPACPRTRRRRGRGADPLPRRDRQLARSTGRRRRSPRGRSSIIRSAASPATAARRRGQAPASLATSVPLGDLATSTRSRPRRVPREPARRSARRAGCPP